MFSIYTSAFLLNKNRFDYNRSLTNFCKFTDKEGEVVIAVPQIPGDDTFETLLKWRRDNSDISSNVHIFICHIDRIDPAFDGKVKDFALQKCQNSICIQMDMDELLPLNNKGKWVDYATFLLSSELQCFSIPSVDLWGNERMVRWDSEKNYSFKWRMHKKGLKRGVVDFAKRPDGTHDITKSDSCELLNEDGSLISSVFSLMEFDPKHLMEPYYAYMKENLYTIHLGYLNIDDRIHRNITFWEDQWSIEDGNRVTLPKTNKDFEHPVFEHGLFEKLEEVC